MGRTLPLPKLGLCSCYHPRKISQVCTHILGHCTWAISDVTWMTWKNLWNFQMYTFFFIIKAQIIYWENVANTVHPKQLFFLMREEKALWLDFKINKGAWNMGAGNNVAEEKNYGEISMGAGKSDKVMRFNDKMIFVNIYCQKISIHPALCITLGSFLPCCVE